MLLYAACGIPAIVTPTGTNKTILAEAEIGFGASRQDEWYESMHELFHDRKMAQRFGENGVRLVEERYSLAVCAPEIEKIIRKCAL